MNKSRINFKIFSIILAVYVFKWISPFLFSSYDIFLYLVPLFWLTLYSYYKIMFPFKNKIDIDNNFQKVKWLAFILFIYCAVYFVLGTFLGYGINPYSDKIFIRNLWKHFIFIIPQEYIRSLLTFQGKKRKLNLFLIVLLFTFIEIDPLYFINETSNFQSFLKYFFQILLISILDNILLIYMTIKSNYINNIIYRFFEASLIFIIPYQPLFSQPLQLMLQVLLVILIILQFEIIDSEIIESKDAKFAKKYNRKQKLKERILASFHVCLLIILILFFSGNLNYLPLTVVSSSMQPYIYRGDVVIVKKLDADEIKRGSLKVGDILAYKVDKILVVHRIINIKKDFNDNFYFGTKGDKNEYADSKKVISDQIIGTVKFPIRYIGYPTIFFRENSFTE